MESKKMNVKIRGFMNAVALTVLLMLAAGMCNAADWSVSLWLTGPDGDVVASQTFEGSGLDTKELFQFDPVDFGEYGRAEDLWLALSTDPSVVLHFSYVSGVSPVQNFNAHATQKIELSTGPASMLPRPPAVA